VSTVLVEKAAAGLEILREKRAVAYFGRHDDLHGSFVREVTPKPRMPSGPVKKKSVKKSVSGRRRR
jgi:hypothetical protein